MAKEREVNTVNYSPLRYPGGKSRLAPFISLLIQKSKIETPIYVEPFAGGAGVALSLLLNSAVDEIVITDYIVSDGAFTVLELNSIDTDLWRKGVGCFGKSFALELQTLSRFILKVA